MGSGAPVRGRGLTLAARFLHPLGVERDEGESMVDDRELLARIGNGDKSAMKALYDRHSAALFHFIRVRTGDAFGAADVMQEVFVTVWRTAARYEGRSSVKTWIFGIARNKAVDQIRRASRVDLREPDETVADDAPSAQSVLEAAGDAARLRECIEALGPPQRAAIGLAFFDDLSYPEIAEVEDVPVGTIKTRIHHAKKLLMRCMTRDRRTVPA